jgi:uncharacterized protein
VFAVTTPESGPFHEGEIAVQERVGVRESARKVGGIVRDTLPPVAADFLSEQNFAVVGFADAAGQVWASLLLGEPGFLAPVSESEVAARPTLPDPGDPLWTRLAETPDGLPLGLLAIELATRKRLRANGTAHGVAGGFDLRLAEVYSNCPKYIQARWVSVGDSRGESYPSEATGETLDAAGREWVTGADTFFIASRHPSRGVDASHRGGPPGFVHLEDDRTLVFGDYAGNRMFNTLGNLEISPEAGLLFVDWQTGSTLQLTGSATVLWEEETAALRSSGVRLDGAQGRAVRFRVARWRRATRVGGFLSQFMEYSPFNPVAG